MFFFCICGWTCLLAVLLFLWEAVCGGNFCSNVFLKGIIIIVCLYFVIIVYALIQNKHHKIKCQALIFQEQEFVLDGDTESAEIIAETQQKLYC